MKYKKSQIDEIVNSDNELIGDKDVPQNGGNLETQANNTTDYNAKVGHQPYRYDMLGRFGFTLLPFFEGEEKETPDPIFEDMAAQLYEFYKEILEYYYRNPQKLKSDFRKYNKEDYESADNNEKFGWSPAKKIINIIKPHFEDAMKDLDDNLKNNIDESAFIGEKIVKKDKDKNELSKEEKKVDDVQTKQIKKIAGLINKLDKNKVKQLKNLLETN